MADLSRSCAAVCDRRRVTVSDTIASSAFDTRSSSASAVRTRLARFGIGQHSKGYDVVVEPARCVEVSTAWTDGDVVRTSTHWCVLAVRCEPCPTPKRISPASSDINLRIGELQKCNLRCSSGVAPV